MEEQFLNKKPPETGFHFTLTAVWALVQDWNFWGGLLLEATAQMLAEKNVIANFFIIFITTCTFCKKLLEICPFVSDGGDSDFLFFKTVYWFWLG